MLQGLKNELMNAPVDMVSPNSVIVALRESECSTLTGADNHTVNQLGFLDSAPVFIAPRWNSVNCLNPSGNAEFQDQLAGGIPVTSVFQSISPPTSGFRGIAKNSGFPDHQFQQLETSKTCILHSSSNASNSSLASALNCEADEALCNVNNKWESDSFRFHSIEQLARENPERSDFQSISSMENLYQNGCMPSDNMNSKLWNELSLSLSTSEPIIVKGTNFLDQYPAMNFSDVDQPCMIGTELRSNPQLRSNPNSCNSRDLSLICGSGSPVHLSQAIVGSRYLSAIQDILSQIACYSLENSDQVSHSTTTVGSGPSRTELRGGKLSGDAKKSHLLSLLQLIDDRYTQCLDEIHTVASAFHAATDLDPRLHTRYALQTITSVYRNLREKITDCIFTMGEHSNTMCAEENEKSFETSFIQKQWALQQMNRKDNQLWRPQRGLPESSVSVLRAWMFQNFLHPYPKDTEKHLLAIKSGLTRNQVSNWFINARVRLWKPMIEEMYAEMSRRKSSQNDAGFERISQSRRSFDNEVSVEPGK